MLDKFKLECYLKPTSYVGLLVSMSYGIALASIWYCHLSMIYALSGSGLIIMDAVRVLCQRVLLCHPRAIVKLIYDGQQWYVCRRNGEQIAAKLRQAIVVTSGLMLLQFQSNAMIWVSRESMEPDNFHRIVLLARIMS